MPTVEKVSGGRVYVRGIGRFSLGDRVDVSESDAAYLCEERGDFERVDDETGGGGFVAQEFVSRTPVAEVASDIRAGEADGHLDQVEQAERNGRDRKTVYEAVDERRED
jgi:hypothetical protein